MTDDDCPLNTPVCLSSGVCIESDSEYCEDNECGLGDPDCDPDDTHGCGDGLICGNNNCDTFHDLGTTGISSGADCCEKGNSVHTLRRYFTVH